jgi:two-component system, OmpR family, response regulator ChvI
MGLDGRGQTPAAGVCPQLLPVDCPPKRFSCSLAGGTIPRMDGCARVLVADDEANLLTNLCFAFRSEGYEVEGFPDGESAWASFQSRRPDLVVLDILMPRADGIEVLRRIRGVDAGVPVMFLTSKDEEFDKVLGLELGADDYLCKPFSLRELEARARALLRRSRHGSSASVCDPAASYPLSASGLDLDPERFEARAGGVAMRLTVTEFRLLACLVAAPGVVKSRDALVAAAYPEETYLSDRAIDCHIKRLRRKIAEAGCDPGAVETIYGLGYRLKGSSPQLKESAP